jgi:hypothetical protein
MLSANKLAIDGNDYEFESDDVQWPDIAKDTDCAILEAHRECGQLYLTVLRVYSGTSTEWDSGKYHEVTA